MYQGNNMQIVPLAAAGIVLLFVLAIAIFGGG
jgi:hypothetical protein